MPAVGAFACEWSPSFNDDEGVRGSLTGEGNTKGLIHHRKSSNYEVAEENPCQLDFRNYDNLIWAAETIRSKIQLKETPRLAIICGTGFSQIADAIREAQVLPFSKICGFPNPHVLGHRGNMVFGYISNTYVVCLQGRFHPYEHRMDLALCAMPVRLMHMLGATTLIVSNAAGGINPRFHYGDLMLIKDQITLPGLAGLGPLLGLNDSRFGERFVSMHNAYDKELRLLTLAAAGKIGIPLQEGVYTMVGGPQYETPAEVAFLRGMGADALGMSTCHEVIVARQCGMRVVGFSLITNLCSTDTETSVEVSHKEVLQVGQEVGERSTQLVTTMVKCMEEQGV